MYVTITIPKYRVTKTGRLIKVGSTTKKVHVKNR